MTLRCVENKGLLSEINKHESDKDITFRDDGHKYWIKGDDKDLVSCTTYIHSFFEEFNTHKIINNILNSDDWKNNREYKYYQMSYEQIKDSWDKNGKSASESGTLMHAIIEKFYNGINVDDVDTEEFNQFLSFYEDHKDLKMYRTEWMIFSEILKITGSIDAVYKNEDGTLTLGDWKRSKEIKFESYGNKFGKYPFYNLQDCNYMHYSLQLNLYRIILEKFYGYKIKDMFLGVFHPDNKDGRYIKIEIPLMEKEAELLLDFRKEQLIKMGYNVDITFKYSIKDVVQRKMEEDEEPVVKSLLRKKDEKPVISLENKGKRWKKEDDELLLSKGKEGCDLKSLSSMFKRSVNSVKIRLIANVLNEHEKQTCKIEMELFSKNYNQFDFKDVKEFLKNKEAYKNEKIESKKKKEENKIMEQKNQIKEQKELSIDNLSVKQKHAYNMIQNGKSVFLTGSAGCGKSAIIKLFSKEYKFLKTVAVTSTTGTSALLINGTTLHSYLGIGLAAESAEVLYLKISKKPYIVKKWKELDVLIIDEISMLSPELFDKLEKIARTIRKNALPFGGIQLILTGDCLQLPNVSNPNMFCFEAESWGKCINQVIYLTEIFRQDDLEFQKVLNEARVGKLSDESVKILKSRVNVELKNDHGIIPTKIYSLNVNVDNENENALNKLAEENENLEFYEYKKTFTVLKKGLKFVEERVNKFTSCVDTLQICPGAQVMLNFNLDLENGLVNGSRGVVTSFEEEFPVVKFLNGDTRTLGYNEWIIEENGEKLISVKQIPLRIAYAYSIHKVQGISLDYAEIDLKNIFEAGQGYVALSRVRTLNGLSLKNFKKESIFANKKACKFYEDIE